MNEESISKNVFTMELKGKCPSARPISKGEKKGGREEGKE
jgi:hypothetical protein